MLEAVGKEDQLRFQQLKDAVEATHVLVNARAESGHVVHGFVHLGRRKMLAHLSVFFACEEQATRWKLGQ